ncbi:MAG: nucleoside-diphosphate sugar epimerase/dehydratase [Candidatus Krumholzibacteria bacterium]|nr:nucleoside-diphosphate sugar epimerase/dehydratase [Candidatus Krumholzibacteria bacterium]MDP6796666.1 nucleoside-diphosphate sugar epimerase/dehydratase [Candidatus Krumholzibacteria bacterium]MDP7021635.1 nucleoside-diphosphate sugar epimerase/dehydratase [Candidatus Krumholzibacteria bacterium]
MKRILILGAGVAGRMVAEEIFSSDGMGIELLGFLDDREDLQGEEAGGFPVHGSCDDLEDKVRELGVDELIIAMPSAGGPEIRRVLRLCRQSGKPFTILPGLRQIITGDARFGQLRPVNPVDLLGRETVDLQEEPVRALVEGRTVLVSGAGGSIGSEISRQIAALGPARLILLGRGENSIFEVEQELRTAWPKLDLLSLIADLRDPDSLLRHFREYQPHVVYHAAAHKHVPFMERFPEEAFLNNVLGTRNLIEAATDSRVDRFVMLSTDKAVDPKGVMGASKRMAELLVFRANSTSAASRFLSVRFGNVLGSRGSVVPLFQGQIERGGPVTVTDAETTRYFMTIREASMLVIQASALGDGGEIFILNMGESLNILELARDLIMLHGLEPGRDIPIEITGMRPGEKLHEQLMSDSEAEASELGERLMILRPPFDPEQEIEGVLREMEDLARRGEGRELARRMLDFTSEWGRDSE